MRGLAVIIALTLVSGCGREPEVPVLPVGGDFTLTDHDGNRFSLPSLRGTVVMVFFGYTFCPDVCPTTLSKLTAVARRLDDDRARVKVVYVTVDPVRDTPEVMKEHLAMYGVPSVGLTGSRDEIDAVVRQFAAAYTIEETPDSAARYLVSHTTTLYVLDGDGHTRFTFPYEATVDEIVEGIRRIL